LPVPFVDLGLQFEEVQTAIDAGFARVLSSASFVGGRDVDEFEQHYAALVGVNHCVGVGNGTDALELALRAVGVSPGSEVIIPTNSFVATAEAVSRIGATPVFVDVDATYLLMDPAQVEEAITPATRAVVPVHLFGQMAATEMLCDVIGTRDISIVEDAAQSQAASRHGRMSGSVGRIAATSFYPGKNLGAAGDAGAVTTDDQSLADHVRLMGSHGSRKKYVHEVVGFNSRLDALQAVVLNAKLTRLRDWNARRRRAAEVYSNLLSDVDTVRLPEVSPGNEHAWHLYVVRVAHRDRVMNTLAEAGVGVGVHYPVPLHLTPAYCNADRRENRFPVAERAAGEILSIPMFPHITVEQQERVAEILIGASSQGG